MIVFLDGPEAFNYLVSHNKHTYTTVYKTYSGHTYELHYTYWMTSTQFKQPVDIWKITPHSVKEWSHAIQNMSLMETDQFNTLVLARALTLNHL